MRKKERQHIQERGIVGFCPSCHFTAQYTDDAVVKVHEDMRLAYGACPTCAFSLLTLEVGREGTVTSVGLLTDLQRQEVEKFWNTPLLQEDDMLRIHELVQSSIIFSKHRS